MRIRLPIISGWIIILSICATGCSGGGSGSSPLAPAGGEECGSPDAHAIWGLWQFTADPANEALDAVQLRAQSMHLNVLRFLEPPVNFFLTVENVKFVGNTIECDIGLRHPFLGQVQFTGFDVCGVAITDGTHMPSDNPELIMAGDGETRLLNADGYTRWWNPAEFPHTGTMLGYKDGLLGTPDAVADYGATLNGYKFFCDDLHEPDAGLDTLEPSNRCVFSAGQKNMRRYLIEIGDGLVFNYAIDACWKFPAGSPPWTAPDDFGPGANRPEAWHISTTVVENKLWNDGSGSGGRLSLSIDVWDHFKADMNSVKVESPGNFAPEVSTIPAGGGDGYSTYEVEITNATPAPESIELLMSVECEAEDYQGLLPGKSVTAYFTQRVPVSNEPPSGIVLECGEEGRIVYYEPGDDNVDTRDEYEPAIIRDLDGNLTLAFFWYRWVAPPQRQNYPRNAVSTDHGDSFAEATSSGYWRGHGNNEFLFNSKLTRGPDGKIWYSYFNTTSPGQTLGIVPYLHPYEHPWDIESASLVGTWAEHGAEVLYTSEGYPMMFGDKDGIIKIRRGDYQNYGSTGPDDWPDFLGTESTLAEDAWVSISRSTGVTSDGICHLVYWKQGINGPIRMLSSDDISGTIWTTENIIENGAAEIWIGARDPSLWIDEDDHFHVTYEGETWMGWDLLVYAHSENGSKWTYKMVDNTVKFEDFELHDAQVVTFRAFAKQYIVLTYEYHGNVWFQWKTADDAEFSDPMQVNEHENAVTPDVYPNGATGITFTYQADGDNGTQDIFYRTCNFVED